MSDPQQVPSNPAAPPPVPPKESDPSNQQQQPQASQQQQQNSSAQQEPPPNQESQSESTPAKPKGPYDIDDKDLTPRFVRAMQTLGYAETDLQPKNREDVIQIVKNKDPLGTKIDEELIGALGNHLEARRKNKIDEIRRERLIIAEPPKASSAQPADKSIIIEKSMVLDRSIASISKSIMSLTPMEYEFKLYDKTKKKERAQLHKALQEEKLLERQVLYEAKQKELEERMRERNEQLRRRRRVEEQQKQEIKNWLHTRQDVNESSLFNSAQYRAMVEELAAAMEEIDKQRGLLNPQERIEKVKSYQDLKLKEVQDLKEKRGAEMQKRLEALRAMALQVRTEKEAKEFNQWYRELEGMIKNEKVVIRKEMMDEYRQFMKIYNQKEKKQMEFRQARQIAQNEFLDRLIAERQRQKELRAQERLEQFKQSQAESLKAKHKVMRTLSEEAKNEFTKLKMDYERRMGFQDDMKREIDRVENIQRRERKAEQERRDNILLKEQAKLEKRQQEMAKYKQVELTMRRFEQSNSETVLKKLQVISSRHIDREKGKDARELELTLEIQEQRKKAQQQRKLEEQKKEEEFAAKNRKQIEAEKKRLQQQEEKLKKEQEEQQQSA